MSTATLKKITIPPYSKVKVQWDDRPENYSRENKNKIRGYFAKKYGVEKNDIKIIFRPVKINEKGDVIERGKRIGRILLGSRVDLFLPQGFKPAVKLGDQVRAGVTVIGEL